jgi:hypothetical protein
MNFAGLGEKLSDYGRNINISFLNNGSVQSPKKIKQKLYILEPCKLCRTGKSHGALQQSL